MCSRSTQSKKRGPLATLLKASIVTIILILSVANVAPVLAAAPVGTTLTLTVNPTSVFGSVMILRPAL